MFGDDIKHKTAFIVSVLLLSHSSYLQKEYEYETLQANEQRLLKCKLCLHLNMDRPTALVL